MTTPILLGPTFRDELFTPEENEFLLLEQSSQFMCLGNTITLGNAYETPKSFQINRSICSKKHALTGLKSSQQCQRPGSSAFSNKGWPQSTSWGREQARAAVGYTDSRALQCLFCNLQSHSCRTGLFILSGTSTLTWIQAYMDFIDQYLNKLSKNRNGST